jgi:hypothetical protein
MRVVVVFTGTSGTGKISFADAAIRRLEVMPIFASSRIARLSVNGREMVETLGSGQ